MCTASAFSERYLGMPLRDDSRYQVCVYFLPSLDLLKLFTAAPGTPAAQLLHFPRLLSKSEPATLPLVRFQRLTGFRYSLRFVASVHQITGGRISGLEMLSHQSRWDFCEHVVNNQIPARDTLFATIWDLLFHLADWILCLFSHNLHKQLH